MWLMVHAACLCVLVFSTDIPGWEKGVFYAEGQNLARLLMEAPANHLTPTIFANTIEEKVASHAERVTVKRRFGLYSSSLEAYRRIFILPQCHSKYLLDLQALMFQ